MDSLNPAFKDLYLDRESLFNEFNIDSQSKSLLYISSFAWGTLTDNEIQNYKEMLSEEYVDSFQNIAIESRHLTFKWIEKFLKAHKEYTFIYRPHPAEHEDPELIALANKFKKFKVINKYSVKQWIVTCDKIYTWFSTSVVEAFFSEKLCLILRPVPIPEQYDVVIMKNADFITN